MKKYRELMNSKELVPVQGQSISKGTLIGFKGLGDSEGITAAYPVWRVVGDEIQFVLYFNESGIPVIDNTWFTSPDLYTNKEPIIVSIEVNNPITFSDQLSKLFP